jgi:hypothetical protein
MKEIEYRYILDKKNNRKHRCPYCGKDKCFTRYVRKTTLLEAGEKYGICSRKDNCEKASKAVYPNGIEEDAIDFVMKIQQQSRKEKPAKFLSKSEYKSKLYREFDNNYFVDFMMKKFGCKNTDLMLQDYKLGTASDAGCLYPYFDHNYNLVTYKTVFYNKDGKRCHDREYNALLDSNKQKHPIPLYGLHLMHRYPDLPIGIVEGEKTCPIMRICNPYILWLAAGSATWLNASKLYPIRKRKIYLFPDVGQYSSWFKILEKIRDRYPTIDINISQECELWHSEGKLNTGDDIADYYLNTYKFDHQKQQMVKNI